MLGKRAEAGGCRPACSWHSLTVSFAALCPQALLLLGLSPISASLQDQHCESLSLASNISGEYLHSTSARVQATTALPPAPARVLHTEPCPKAGAAERFPLSGPSNSSSLHGGSDVLRRILKSWWERELQLGDSICVGIGGACGKWAE